MITPAAETVGSVRVPLKHVLCFCMCIPCEKGVTQK